MTQGNDKNGTSLLKVSDLRKYFPITSGIFSSVSGWIRAVDGVSFKVAEGETLGLVGESGCGKTTCGRAVIKLIEPTGGTVTFEGREIQNLRSRDLTPFRRKMQIVFQDPYSSLNPRKTVLDIIGESLQVHGVARGEEKKRRVRELCEQVGLSPSYIYRYPHEFSGGQRQRIGVARALSLSPKFIVCDEPVSALDVSIQAQVLNLLIGLKNRFNLAYLFISHDLSVVKHISDRIAVMYLGRIVETARKDELFENPKHPYTRALLSAVPVPHPGSKTKRIVVEGEPPSPANPPPGCHFHPRCPYRRPECDKEPPPLKHVSNAHSYTCIF